MPFIEGFVTAIPEQKRRAFTDHARKAADLFRDYGATRIVDAWGDAVPEGQITDFYRAVDAKPDEAIGFGWIEYADRATRDAAMQKMMNDPRMQEMGEMPFDGKRMIFAGFEPVVERGSGGKAGYVEGFVGAVPTANRDKFIQHASDAAPLFLDAGALRVVECWGADVPKGKWTDFYRATQAKDDETIIFSWVEWPDRAAHVAGQQKVMEQMEEHMKINPMPFDAKRVIFGGFEIVSEAGA